MYLNLATQVHPPITAVKQNNVATVVSDRTVSVSHLKKGGSLYGSLVYDSYGTESCEDSIVGYESHSVTNNDLYSRFLFVTA